MTGVSWYEVVKWLNAWSEKEGRKPVYWVDNEVYRTGEHDNVVQSWSYSRAGSGYRLPVADGSGMGIRLSGRDDNAVLHGRKGATG